MHCTSLYPTIMGYTSYTPHVPAGSMVEKHELTHIITVGWGSTQNEPAFGGMQDNAGVKSKLINLINSVRTLMRSTFHHRVPLHAGSNVRWLSANDKTTVPLIFINALIIVWAVAFG